MDTDELQSEIGDIRRDAGLLVARNTGTGMSAAGVWKVWLSNMRGGYWGT